MSEKLLINDIKSNNSEFKSNNEEKQIEQIACKNCIHYEVCMYVNAQVVEYTRAENCKLFKDNANYRKQEWISVDERLPPKHDEVLVFCDGARQLDFICSSGRWYDHDHKKVTHWMPLPEAPKMKGGAE